MKTAIARYTGAAKQTTTPRNAAMIDVETLNVMQQVLKCITVSLAMHHKEDMPKLASAIQAWASTPTLDSHAKAMLFDIAQGLDMLGSAQMKQA
jgi:hypothetical protein